ncbi:MASE1 domain-containing protein [Alkalilimnicola sp. S0819]|uniref:MASE1 domain-containing protein n=1 Tax=Alkalilimnicola sp. S0819 TaxID=2613922 RepID=UPI001261CF29|nr:MASE1 domain-containing protein [Alkalilimnicola sp. S0819]KAB7622688.1 histidine kinase [Alkalilimnicola sp. S0819]MPQ17326.1 histidine kinase [Alkalilimnicola sp. S0819]
MQRHAGRWGAYSIGALLQLAAAAMYYAVAALGMSFTQPQAAISLIWPATGAALTMVYLFGYRYLVGVALGAFAYHWQLDGDTVNAAALALGIAAAAALGALGLRRLADFSGTLERVRDVLLFLLIAVILVSGVSSLLSAGLAALDGRAQWGGFGSLWWACWTADMMGTLLLAPVLLTWCGRPLPRWSVGRWLEAVVLLGLVTLNAWVVYADHLPTDYAMARPLVYTVYPLMIWGALRFENRWMATLLLLNAGIAVYFTARGLGPFATGSLRENMLSLDANLSLLSVTVLILTALITERLKAERQARRHLQELAHFGRIGDMGQMSAGLAHELNQPLTAIMTYTQAARRLLQSRLQDAELDQALERVVANAERAALIIREMRAFVRKDAPQRRRADINRLVTEVLDLVGHSARRHRVAILTDLGAQLPAVEVAEVQIHQVLVNLIRNAVDAIAEADTVHRDILIRTATCADGVEVVVSDSGPGLPTTVVNELFEPFVSSKSGGMGLGLSISRAIIEAHDGRLEAGTSRRGGAEFRFVLPAHTEEKQGHDRQAQRVHRR